MDKPVVGLGSKPYLTINTKGRGRLQRRVRGPLLWGTRQGPTVGKTRSRNTGKEGTAKMILRATVAALGAVLLLVPAARATESATPAEVFVHEMLGGVGAVEVDCPQQVLQRIESR